MTLHRCSQCNKSKECRWSEDPFMAELYPEAPNDPAWWCDDCYEQACDDI